MNTLLTRFSHRALVQLRASLSAGLFAFLVTLPSLACAQAQAQAEAQGPETGAYMLQTTLGLGFVLLLLMALLWVMKRTGLNQGFKQSGFYKVVASSSLGPRERIVLVEVGDTWLMLGITQHSINTLHSMPKNSIDLGNKEASAQAFASMLDKFKQIKKPTHE